MKIIIKSTNMEYETGRITDFGILHNIMEFVHKDYAGKALFKAEVGTAIGIKTVIGVADRGELTGEWCENIIVNGIQVKEDTEAILSLKESLFKDFDTREVYMIGKTVAQPALFEKKMTFEKAIEALVKAAYERTQQRETKKEAMLKNDDSLIINAKPAYKLGDRFALITMNFVCAPIKIVKRMAVVDYDTGKVNFLYNLRTDFPSGKPEPLDWENVEESKLQDWARSSAYDIKNNKRFESTREIAYRYSDLVNMKE